MTKKENKKNNTFIVKITNTEHHSWQGVIEWVESKHTVPFRSALEMLKLIDSAVINESEE